MSFGTSLRAGYDENKIVISSIQTNFIPLKDNGTSMVGTNCASDINHESLNSLSNLADHQRLPPTPPATPPNYRSEDILSENTSSESFQSVEIVPISEKDTANFLIAQPNDSSPCSSINSTYSQISLNPQIRLLFTASQRRQS